MEQLLVVSKCLQPEGIADFLHRTATGGFALTPSVANEPGYVSAATTSDALAANALGRMTGAPDRLRGDGRISQPSMWTN